MESHVSVLKNEVLEAFDYLKTRDNPIFVDGTLGAGGHSLAICEKYLKDKMAGRIIGIDQDQSALDLAKTNAEKIDCQDSIIFVHDNFSNIKNVIFDLKIKKIDGAMLDLGISSMQLDQKSRGFSFSDPYQPLDMRMDQSQELTAAKILNTYPEGKIRQILEEYGEERLSYKIARAIIERRKEKSFESVGHLLKVLENTIPKSFQFGRIHFATKTFQALRIETNDELGRIEGAIKDIVDLLEKGSRLAIISFHSLEDRIVKNAFKHLEDPCQCPPKLPCVCGLKPKGNIITKKPIVPTESEIYTNHRSRSAKLRIIEKI